MNSSFNFNQWELCFFIRGQGMKQQHLCPKIQCYFIVIIFYFSLYSALSKAAMNIFKIKYMYQNMLWERFRNALEKVTWKIKILNLRHNIFNTEIIHSVFTTKHRFKHISRSDFAVSRFLNWKGPVRHLNKNFWIESVYKSCYSREECI